VLCFTASVFGGLITTLATLALLPWLSQLGLYLRSVEMVVVMLFGLTLIAVIAAKDTLKALIIAGFFGLLIGVIGTDHIYNTPRATFGLLELYDGVPLVPALIGLFAISEALVMLEEKIIVEAGGRDRALGASWADTLEGLRLSARKWWHIVWTSFVGLFIGIVPGAGASIASFVAYQQSRLWSKHPERYGSGVPEGVIAPEAANNGVTSGTLVPMMALGVPGGSTAAVMMIVLQYHGMLMGPRLFTTNPEVAYGVFVSMAVAYLFMLFTILPLARYKARVVLIPTAYLAPVIILVTIVAAFGERQYLFDMALALAFGVIGYVAHKTQYHVTAILIGILLGPLFEQYLVRALRISEGDIGVLFSSTLGNVLWALLALSLVLPLTRRAAAARAPRRSADAE
jgi:putative tricarboxylic transport membrane protein